MEKLNIAQNESLCYFKQLSPMERKLDLKFKNLGWVLALPLSTRVITDKLFYLLRTQFSHLQNGNTRPSQRGWAQQHSVVSFTSVHMSCVPASSLTAPCRQGCTCFVYTGFQGLVNCRFTLQKNKFPEETQNEGALPEALWEQPWACSHTCRHSAVFLTGLGSSKTARPSPYSQHLAQCPAQHGHSMPLSRTSVWGATTLDLWVETTP